MNQFLTTDWLSMKALRLLLNKLAVAMYFNDSYNSEYQRPFTPGETIRVEYPPLWDIRNGVGYNPQAIQEIYTTITVDQIFGVDFQWDDVEAALKLERDDTRQNDFYMKGPMKKIAQEWDMRCALFGYVYTPNIVGVLGTNPTTFSTFSTAAEQILFEQGGVDGTQEQGDVAQIISSGMNTGLIANMTTNFNPQTDVSKQQRESRLGYIATFDTIRSMSLRRHTNGTVAGAFTVAGADQSGSSLLVNLTAGDTITRGTKIGIGNCYPTNPLTRETVTTGRTFIFSVTQDLTAVGGGADALQITPPIYGPLSVFQNISALPANGATLTVTPGTASPNTKAGIVGLALQRDAFFRVNVPLQLPKAVEIARQQRDSETGFTIRFTRTWDAIQMRNINRFDTLGGFGVGYNYSCAVAMLGA
jgi:hypothetical protein